MIERKAKISEASKIKSEDKEAKNQAYAKEFADKQKAKAK